MTGKLNIRTVQNPQDQAPGTSSGKSRPPRKRSKLSRERRRKKCRQKRKAKLEAAPPVNSDTIADAMIAEALLRREKRARAMAPATKKRPDTQIEIGPQPIRRPPGHVAGCFA